MEFRLRRTFAALACAAAMLASDAAAVSRVDLSYPEFAKADATCRRVGDPQPLRADRPTRAEARGLKGCKSARFYYGIGGRRDYHRARLCAFLEPAPSPQTDVSGPAMLMQLYGNGLGVKRNIDLATAYACQIDGAPAETNARVTHLQDLRTSPGRIDYCDDITSGLAGGVCAGLKADREESPRRARITAARARLNPQARRLYPALAKALDAYVDAAGERVYDGGGTGAAGFQINEERALRDAFAADLERLAAGRWPAASAAQATAADARLKAAYKSAIAEARTDGDRAAVEEKDLRIAARAWLNFRDAFLRYAAVAAPSVSREALLTYLTRERIKALYGLAPVG